MIQVGTEGNICASVTTWVSMTHLTAIELRRLSNWQRGHKCDKKSDGVQLIQSPTSIGTATEIKCACGASKKITDYSAW